jgi:hypothetical protein
VTRLFTFQNLIEATLLAIAITLGCGVAAAQEPEPTPAMSLKVDERADAHTLVRVSIQGVEIKDSDGVAWDVVCGAKFLAADQVEALRTSMIFTGPESPEPYRVRLTFFRDGVMQRLESKVLIGRAPQPPPVIIPPLKQLAGVDAAKLSAVYAELGEGIASKIIDTPELFFTLEKQLLERRGLLANKAVPEIAKRLAGKDLAGIAGEIAKVAEELGAAPGPTPPIPGGQKHIVILRETADDTPEQARMWNLLRTGEHAAYLKSKGHKLEILDDDSVDQNGQPSKLVEGLKPLATSLPFLFILEPSDGRPLHSQAVPATAAQVMEVIKSHGG